MAETLASSPDRFTGFPSTAPTDFGLGGVERGPAGWDGVGKTPCWVLKEQPVAPVGVVVVSVQALMEATSTSDGIGLVSGVGCGGLVKCWGFCLLFENYTVDASIFVVKFFRANGGCLGTRSR
jgi:hypothetical protein